MSAPPQFARPYLPPSDHLAAIGAVAVLWTAIEASMQTIILGLYEIDLNRGLVLTNNLSFHARLSLLRILAGEGAIEDAALAEQMKSILTRIDTAFGIRNAVIHGLWGMSEKPGIARRASIRARGKKLQTLMDDYSAADLWKIADDLAALVREFAALERRFEADRASTKGLPNTDSMSK